MGCGLSKTIAQDTKLHEFEQREFTVQEFHGWILSDYYRRQTAIRRVDLIKSTEATHAFHEGLMLHVYGPLGRTTNTEQDRIFSAWRIILERAGTIPMSIHEKMDVAQMTVAEATKFTPLNPGPAADRVILMPCSLAPEDPSKIPFMKNQVVVKTLQVPYESFYLDRARAARYGAHQRGEPIPDHDYDFNSTAVQTDFHNVNGWPLLQPLCLQLESMPPEVEGYRLFSTNCYFFARTLFDALEYAHGSGWEIEQGNVPRKSRRQKSIFGSVAGEKLGPLQRAALWLNGALSGTTEMGDLIERTARDIAEGMQNTSAYAEIVGMLDEDEGEELPPVRVKRRARSGPL